MSSSRFNFGSMSGSKKDKSYANTGHRRSSIVVHGGKPKIKRDTDSESISSTASTAIPPPPPKPSCPLRPYMEAMFEPEDCSGGVKKSLCPLKRVKLSHTIPLMIFIMINMCLVVITLLVTGLVRVVSGMSDLGRKQSRENTIVASQRYDANALSIFASTLLAFIVVACYGPQWMSSSFRIGTSIGFFGLLLTLLINQKDVKKTAQKASVVEEAEEKELFC